MEDLVSMVDSLDESTPVDDSSASFAEILEMTSEEPSGEGHPLEDGVRDGEESSSKDLEESKDPEASEAEEEKEKTPEAKGDSVPGVYKVKDRHGKEVEINDDVTFTRKVNGEDVEISLKQALRHEVFDLPYQEMMNEARALKKDAETAKQEASSEKGQLESQLNLVREQLTKEIQPLQQGSVKDWIFEYASIRNIDPGKLYSLVRDGMLEDVQAYINADEDGRKVLDNQTNSLYNGRTLEQTKNALALQKRGKQYEELAVKGMREAGITEQQFREAAEKVNREHLGGKTPNLLSYSPDDVSKYLEAVVLTAKADQQSTRITDLISESAPDLRDTDPVRFEEVLDFVSRYSDYHEDDLRDLVKSMTAEASSEKDVEDDDAVPISKEQAQEARKRTQSDSSNELAQGDEDHALDVFTRPSGNIY